MVLACMTITEKSSLAITGYLYPVLEVAEIDCKPAELGKAAAQTAVRHNMNNGNHRALCCWVRNYLFYYYFFYYYYYFYG